MPFDRRAIFLDRDGVINKEKGYVYKIKDFEFERNALRGLKKIDFNEYLVFIVANQAGIARGFYQESDFKKIDNWLKKKLKEKGILIKKTYHCPHHPQNKCSCRKPATGLLMRAKKDFKLDFKSSFFIGDKTCDILAGKRAGCKTILVKTGYGGKDGRFSIKPDFAAKDLYEAVKIINKRFGNYNK